jgi:hypothetical protein
MALFLAAAAESTAADKAFKAACPAPDGGGGRGWVTGGGGSAAGGADLQEITKRISKTNKKLAKKTFFFMNAPLQNKNSKIRPGTA